MKSILIIGYGVVGHNLHKLLKDVIEFNDNQKEKYH